MLFIFIQKETYYEFCAKHNVRKMNILNKETDYPTVSKQKLY